MEYERHYSEAVSTLEPIEIREVMASISGRDVVSLAAGWPNPAAFPVEEIGSIVDDLLAEEGGAALQYGSSRGLDGLRAAVARYLHERHGAAVGPENVVVTAGSQQGLFLAARALADPGDEVAVGAPTYVAALTAFRTLGDPSFVTVPLDDDGMRTDALEAALAEADPSVVYVVPTFQNPTGTTMSAERRERLLELAEAHDFLVVEDQPYAELRYGADVPPPLVSMDDRRVLHLGTLSKVLAPGLRVGWVVGPEPVVETLEVLRQPMDIHASSLSQAVAREFLATDAIDGQIEALRSLYRPKRDRMLDALAAEMPGGVEWTRPDGGMFVWLTLPDGVDATALLADAVERGVAFVPGSAFYADRGASNDLRLNFTYVSDGEIDAGIALLADAIDDAT